MILSSLVKLCTEVHLLVQQDYKLRNAHNHAQEMELASASGEENDEHKGICLVEISKIFCENEFFLGNNDF